MDISIKKEVFSKFAELNIVFIAVRGMDNKSKLKESLHLLKEAEEFIQLTFNKETPENHYLIQPWTAAKLGFGKKAKHYHTSVERLIDEILDGRVVEAKDVLTNILRYIALKQIIPFGADDLKNVEAQITFEIAKGREGAGSRRKAGGPKKLAKGDLYYKDAKDILGTKLDYWKNPKTELAPETKNALIHFEALPPIDSRKIKEITDEAANLIVNFCGGKAKVILLNRKKTSAKI